MNPTIQLFLYFLTGVTFAIAAVNLIIAFQKGSEKSYLFLGLMGLSVGIYYLMFSFTSVLEPNGASSKIALLFFLSSFGLLPWFFCAYTGFCRIKTQWLLTAGMTVAYILLLFTNDYSKPVLWNLIGHLVLIGIIWFGFIGVKHQRKRGDRRSALLLLLALVILALLTLDDIIRMHFSDFYPFNISDDILPLDYFLVFFMVLIGLKLARDMQRKYSLERSFNLQEKRWSTLLEKIQLLVVGVDRDEKINYVNPYFLELTGYKKENILGKHYMTIIPEDQKIKLSKILSGIDGLDGLPYYQNTILTKHGDKKRIAWSLVGIYDENAKLISSISIGSNITEQQEAFDEIRLLKSKLEEENIILKSELRKYPYAEKIIGKSDAIRYVLQRAQQVAQTDSTVLLEGETGVGKELVANYIQQNSLRADKPFIKINCAAIPATLLESELFGHVKGAFTGADKNKKGLAEIAHQGTLLLDEIGEFPLELQPKLLRFLQEGEFVPLGSEAPKTVNVRIIAATNKELLKEIEVGKFRNDLYYRLYVYPITIPTLRNRLEDIPELVELFVKEYAKKHRKPIEKISKTVITNLQKYSWPGNIRELENVVERAVIVCQSDTIRQKDLSPIVDSRGVEKRSTNPRIRKLDEVERDHIIMALESTHWKVHGSSGAAELLGINPSTLRSRMKKLDISKPK